ncbi:MAG: 16S rRNA (guanine(966)-N(2))-methyltransferase RsmD [Balneolaceae bacterium]
MRIITGKLKGRTIPVPDTGELRPTSDRTKEGLFGVIAARRFFEGCRVLDLFAGSGNLGFEAISRGADHVLFVDRNAEHLKHIEQLSREFKVDNQTATVLKPAEEFLQGTPVPSDLIFCDPPYDYVYMDDMIAIILEKEWLNTEGWFILEHDKRYDFQDHDHTFHTKAYGRTIVSIFQKQPVIS